MPSCAWRASSRNPCALRRGRGGAACPAVAALGRGRTGAQRLRQPAIDRDAGDRPRTSRRDGLIPGEDGRGRSPSASGGGPESHLVRSGGAGASPVRLRPGDDPPGCMTRTAKRSTEDPCPGAVSIPDEVEAPDPQADPADLADPTPTSPSRTPAIAQTLEPVHLPGRPSGQARPHRAGDLRNRGRTAQGRRQPRRHVARRAPPGGRALRAGPRRLRGAPSPSRGHHPSRRRRATSSGRRARRLRGGADRGPPGDGDAAPAPASRPPTRSWPCAGHWNGWPASRPSTTTRVPERPCPPPRPARVGTARRRTRDEDPQTDRRDRRCPPLRCIERRPPGQRDGARTRAPAPGLAATSPDRAD